MNAMKYSIAVAVFFLLFATSCENDFDKVNTNPNQSTDAATPALLSQAIRDLAYNNHDVWYLCRQSGVVSQHFAQRNYTSEDRYSFRVGTTDGFFRNNYIYMNNLQHIIELNTNPATKDKYASLYGANKMQIATAEIVKAWGLQLLTDYFGDIPYSQAFDVNKYPQPAYDSQKAVYDGLIATLKKAATDLSASPSGFSQGDLFYNGDLDQWVKLANSLRLRLALRASKADPKYLDEAKAAIADGVFESNADNAACAFSTSGEPNEAPLYNGYYVNGRNDFTFTAQFMELLKGNNYNDFQNPFHGLRDPRYKVYTTYTSDRLGVPYGMPDATTQRWWSANSSKRVSLYSVNPVFLNANFPATFIDYATVCFMGAEVKNMDAELFMKGMEASFEQWGVTDGGNYIDSVMVRFNAPATTTEMKKEMVITQKYMHLLTQSHEAWSEYRRTGYPKSLVKPGKVTAVINGEEVRFEPIPGSESGSDIAARFKYPTSEYTLNKENVEKAATAMGEDSHKQKVWWAGGGKQ
jgi:hypothetical protein